MQKIGILGFGVVGKSVLTFLREQTPVSVAVWDARALTADEQALLQKHDAEFVASSMTEFVATHDVVVASPGVDVSSCADYTHKIVGELDLFAPLMHKPTVAITGSLGKTTITKLLAALAQKIMHERTVIGGNIGIGMLDLLKRQDSFDRAFLELSSFQLESNKTYAPDVAVWTNFYPNHLDRHKTIETYFQAKFKLFQFQKQGQHALFPLELLQKRDFSLSSQTAIWDPLQLLSTIASHVSFFTHQKPTDKSIAAINLPNVRVFYGDEGWLWSMMVHNGCAQQPEKLCSMQTLPSITYPQNWICILATLYLLGARLEQVDHIGSDTTLLDDHHHRLEHCGTVQGVDFYNDSKSTLIQATQAAVQQCAQKNRPLIVILGGLSKGADRSPLMTFLKTVPQIKKIYCYGPECAAFAECAVLPSLEAILHDIVAIMQPGDVVLFSPSGTSFDFYRNYQHRGDVFKTLVRGIHIIDHQRVF